MESRRVHPGPRIRNGEEMLHGQAPVALEWGVSGIFQQLLPLFQGPQPEEWPPHPQNSSCMYVRCGPGLPG